MPKNSYTGQPLSELAKLKTARVKDIRAIEDDIEQIEAAIQAQLSEFKAQARAERALAGLTPEQIAAVSAKIQGVAAQASAGGNG